MLPAFELANQLSNDASVAVADRPAQTRKDGLLDAPAPGVHPSTRFITYQRWDAAHSHGLHDLARSPKHFKASRDQPLDTQSLRVGHASHTAILEPDLFDGLYVLAQTCQETTKSQTRCTKGGTTLIDGKFYCTQHAEKLNAPADSTVTLLSAALYNDARRMAEAVRDHPIAAEILERASHRELSLTWDDPETGIRCKARLDLFEPGTVTDLKSIADARDDTVRRQIGDYGYHRQLSFYQAGALANDLPAEVLQFIFVENTAPYGVRVLRLDEISRHHALIEIPRLLRTYAECRRTDTWPGYALEIGETGLAPWRLRGVAA